MSQSTTSTLKYEDLHQFTGTEHHWQNPAAPGIRYTDGVKYLAEAGQAYWLITLIASLNAYNKAERAEEFQVWTLTQGWPKATLTCTDGDDNLIYSGSITTDFPLKTVSLWFTNKVLYLPSEH